MRDGGPVGGLLGGSLAINVNPLMIIRGIGKSVDALLGHFDPIAGADLGADQFSELFDIGDHSSCHAMLLLNR